MFELMQCVSLLDAIQYCNGKTCIGKPCTQILSPLATPTTPFVNVGLKSINQCLNT
jgi:hypothetical protein